MLLDSSGALVVMQSNSIPTLSIVVDCLWFRPTFNSITQGMHIPLKTV